MSQENTYRPAVLPSEAAMMPAVEEIADAPPPAAQEAVYENDPAMLPAQRRQASVTLERLRNRMRGYVPEEMDWISTEREPLDRTSSRREQRRSADRMLEPSETPLNRSLTQGAALSSLMRSATRQFTPAPMLAQPQAPQMPGNGSGFMQTTNQSQMRGALRRVVRNAQQPQQFSAVRPGSLNNQG